jgi:hypothetical protein
MGITAPASAGIGVRRKKAATGASLNNGLGRAAYCGNVKVEVCPFRFSMVNPSEFVTTLTW